MGRETVFKFGERAGEHIMAMSAIHTKLDSKDGLVCWEQSIQENTACHSRSFVAYFHPDSV